MKHPTFVYCRGERFKILIEEKTLLKRIGEIARQIDIEYEEKKPILVGILNGSFIFIADLMREITIDCEVDFIKLSSYGEAKISSGNVTELKRIDANLEGRHVLIIEDIVDTGHSMQFMLERLESLNPASVKVVTLLHKPSATIKTIPLDYVGFEIENLFVIGYGLDYAQLGRNLRAIYVIDHDEET